MHGYSFQDNKYCFHARVVGDLIDLRGFTIVDCSLHVYPQDTHAKTGGDGILYGERDRVCLQSRKSALST